MSEDMKDWLDEHLDEDGEYYKTPEGKVLRNLIEVDLRGLDFQIKHSAMEQVERLVDYIGRVQAELTKYESIMSDDIKDSSWYGDVKTIKSNLDTLIMDADRAYAHLRSIYQEANRLSIKLHQLDARVRS